MEIRDEKKQRKTKTKESNIKPDKYIIVARLKDGRDLVETHGRWDNPGELRDFIDTMQSKVYNHLAKLSKRHTNEQSVNKVPEPSQDNTNNTSEVNIEDKQE